MKKFAAVILLILSLALLSLGESRSATWVVARNGSGDYSRIQNALDVCAAGDTIQIRPGRYDEFQVHAFGLGGSAAVVMIPKVAPLTIQGAGRDSVFIGPEVMSASYHGQQTAIMTADGVKSGRISVSGVTMANGEWLATLRSPFTFLDCRFGTARQAEIALDTARDVLLQNCVFEGSGSTDGIVSFTGGENPRLRVANCTFENLANAIVLRGSEGFELSRLNFSDVGTAIGIQYGSTGDVSECDIGKSPLPVGRIVLSGGCRVTMSRVDVAASSLALKMVDAETILDASHLRLAGGSYFTVYVATGASLILHDSDILNGGGVSVMARDLLDSSGRVDLRHCYWGTTNSLQVEKWLFDGKDDPRYKHALVQPIESVPLARDPKRVAD